MKTAEIISKFSNLALVKKSNDVFEVSVSRDELAFVTASLVNGYKLPLSLLFGTDDRVEKKSFGVHAVFSNDVAHERLIVSASIPESDPVYPSITRTVMAAHWYERYLRDMFGIEPEGHPDLRRLVRHENVPENIFPLRKDFAWNTKMEHANVEYPMLHVEGEEIYEIPVGPIHAGIIEPGHFRFNVAGERIITLEGKLFFTHKGVEKLLEGKTVSEGLPFIERLSGDMAASHALAYVQAVESISGCEIPKRAKMLRALICELERMTMHIHDLGNIGGMGTGYSFVAANCFRIKERMMRLSEKMLGNRFWRGAIVPGGVSKDFAEAELRHTFSVAKGACEETLDIVGTALDSDGFLDRLQTTGILPKDAAEAFGALGVPARASGLDRDVRRDFPYASYAEFPAEVVTETTGDVYARYKVRIEELKQAIGLIEKIISNLEDGEIVAGCGIKDGFGLGAVESWRGEVLCALRIKDGIIDRCFPRDPSFCNWALFGIIGPGNIVPDFPICNKSLNLSYSGTDM
ncbi:MAG: NADH-quinone oxidoreductase subunit C [Parcubacteria group bacterium]